MIKILIAYSIPRESFDSLPSGFEITFPDKEFFTKEELLTLIPDYDVLLSIFCRPVENEIIDAGKKLKLISNFGVGFNNIDIVYARSKNIPVCNTPEAVCNPTAELCMALILGIARRIGECDRRIRTEKESMWGVMQNLGSGLEGKTLGIIGMGSIGCNVARKAEAFGMNIIYCNRHNQKERYHRTDLITLLKESDFITLHTPLTAETRHLIGSPELSLMKKTAFLINTSRGAVIDEQALTDTLQKKQIAGAALDVYEYEPHITDALYDMENVLLVPHIGTATIDARITMGREALCNILNFFSGIPSNIVN